MSLSKFESEIKIIPQPTETVYQRFADLRNLQGLKERLNDPAVAEQMAANVPEEKMEEIRKYVEQMTFDEDSLQIASPMGALTLRIVERETPKLIKLAGENTPLPIFLWIQLLPAGEEETKMRVTVGAEVNFFMKSMVAKPLQQAAEGLANILAATR